MSSQPTSENWSDSLWAALGRAAMRLEEEPQILWEKKPEWSEGLSIRQINQLAKKHHLGSGLVFVTERKTAKSADGSGKLEIERWLQVNHPNQADPVRFCTWSRNGLRGCPQKRIERAVQYLRAWQNLRTQQLTQTSRPPKKKRGRRTRKPDKLDQAIARMISSGDDEKYGPSELMRRYGIQCNYSTFRTRRSRAQVVQDTLSNKNNSER